MQDTIIKGTGNSRTLASVPNFLTLYPSYEAFGQALINRELPIDLGPLNPTGLNVRGTDLNKENLLKDDTAALYGLGTDATPDQVLAAIRPLLTTALGKASIEIGTYQGSGSATWTLNFGISPKVVAIVGNVYRHYSTIFIRGVSEGHALPPTTNADYGKIKLSWGAKSLTLTFTQYVGTTTTTIPLNFVSNQYHETYYYFALG